MSGKWAVPFKPYFGTKAYDIAAMKCIWNGLFDEYDWDCEIDGKKFTTPGHDSLKSAFMFQFSGNKIADRPSCFSSVINHGCFDITFMKNPQLFKTMKNMTASGERLKEGLCENYTGNYGW